MTSVNDSVTRRTSSPTRESRSPDPDASSSVASSSSARSTTVSRRSASAGSAVRASSATDRKVASPPTTAAPTIQSTAAVTVGRRAAVDDDVDDPAEHPGRDQAGEALDGEHRRAAGQRPRPLAQQPARQRRGLARGRDGKQWRRSSQHRRPVVLAAPTARRACRPPRPRRRPGARPGRRGRAAPGCWSARGWRRRLRRTSSIPWAMRCSVTASTAVVGSCSTSTGGSAASARARPRRCRCPPESVMPLTVTGSSGQVGRRPRRRARPASCCSSSRDAGSMLECRVPSKRSTWCSATTSSRCDSSMVSSVSGTPATSTRPVAGEPSPRRRCISAPASAGSSATSATVCPGPTSMVTSRSEPSLTDSRARPAGPVAARVPTSTSGGAARSPTMRRAEARERASLATR